LTVRFYPVKSLVLLSLILSKNTFLAFSKLTFLQKTTENFSDSASKAKGLQRYCLIFNLQNFLRIFRKKVRRNPIKHSLCASLLKRVQK